MLQKELPCFSELILSCFIMSEPHAGSEQSQGLRYLSQTREEAGGKPRRDSHYGTTVLRLYWLCGTPEDA